MAMVSKVKKIAKPCLLDPFKEYLTDDIVYCEGIIPNVYQIVDGKVSVDPGILSNLAKHRFGIFNMSTNHWGPTTGAIDMVYDILDSTGMNFVILSHEPADHLRRPNLRYYPVWYYSSLTEFHYDLDVPDHPRRYKVSCLNGLCRPHRIYTWLELRRRPWFDQCYATMHYNKFGRSTEDLDRPDNSILATETWAEWDSIKNSLLEFDTGHWWWSVDPGYSDSYIHLVTESITCNRVFISEKSWKPLINMQLEVIQGTPGTVATLRSHGVDMFDDIIDHGYDSEPDERKRTDLILKELDRLVELDLEAVFKATYARRKNNQQLIMSGAIGREWHDNIVNLINTVK
jgi:hypothetical protein